MKSGIDGYCRWTQRKITLRGLSGVAGHTLLLGHAGDGVEVIHALPTGEFSRRQSMYGGGGADAAIHDVPAFIRTADSDDFTRWVFPHLFRSRVPRSEASTGLSRLNRDIGAGGRRAQRARLPRASRIGHCAG